MIDAGGDTTRNLVAAGLQALFERPDQMKALLDDLPGRLPGAIEEMLRFTSLVASAILRPGTASPPSAHSPSRDRRLSWAALMQRVFARDMLECPACGGRMRVIAAIEHPTVIEAILRSLHLATRAPPIAPARASELPPFSDSAFADSDPDLDQSVELDDLPPQSSD